MLLTNRAALREARVEADAGPLEPYQCGACGVPLHLTSVHGFCRACEKANPCEWCNRVEPQWWADYCAGSLAS